MAETQSEMALTAPALPPVGKWEQVKQTFLDQQHDPAAQSDALLRDTILQALGQHHLLGRGNVAYINVTARSGVATLTGHVVRASDKVQAEATAREVAGVTAVVNQLVVDYDLMINVAQALGQSGQMQHEQIQVNVQHGVVYLGGNVNHSPARLAAGQIAAAVPQARGIINVIHTPGSVLDSEEERFIQPRIGSEIYATDGQVGRVQQVIINPQNRRVTAVTLQTQIAQPAALAWTDVPVERPQTPHPALIALSRIRCAPSGALFLNVNSNKIAHSTDFNAADYVAPPMDWQPPYPYRSADVLFSKVQSRKESL